MSNSNSNTENENDVLGVEGDNYGSMTNGSNNKASISKRRPQFTAMEDLMVCKAYIKASKDSIHGSKQKISLFQSQLIIVYNSIKHQQEEDDAMEASKPLHLKPNGGGCPGIKVSYPEHSGSSIFQHFSHKISPAVIKFMGIMKQVIFHFAIYMILFSQIFCFCYLRLQSKVVKTKLPTMSGFATFSKRNLVTLFAFFHATFFYVISQKF